MGNLDQSPWKLPAEFPGSNRIEPQPTWLVVRGKFYWVYFFSFVSFFTFTELWHGHGFLSCICDSFVCVYTRGVGHTDSESAPHFWLGKNKTHKHFLCSWRGSNLGHWCHRILSPLLYLFTNLATLSSHFCAYLYEQVYIHDGILSLWYSREIKYKYLSLSGYLSMLALRKFYSAQILLPLMVTSRMNSSYRASTFL